MTWAKIDDAYFENGKVLSVTGQARCLHLASMIWAAGKSRGTGILPKAVLPKLGIDVGLSAKPLEQAAEQLVKKGLWQDEGDSWVIHHFIPFTPLKKREENAARLADWRNRKKAESLVKDDFTLATGQTERQAGKRPVPDVPSVLPEPVPEDKASLSPDGAKEAHGAPVENPPVELDERRRLKELRDQVCRLWAEHQGWPLGKWPPERRHDAILITEWVRDKGYSSSTWQRAIAAVPKGSEFTYLTTPPGPNRVPRLEEWAIGWLAEQRERESKKRDRQLAVVGGGRSVGEVLAEASRRAEKDPA